MAAVSQDGGEAARCGGRLGGMGARPVSWTEVGDGVLVRRHEQLDLNCGLVLGDGACLVVDTRSHLLAGRELVDAVRSVTADPVTVVNTHAHFDHCFGNAAFRPAPVWASRGCAEELRSAGEAQRAAVVAGLRADGHAAEAELVAAAPIDLPDHLVDAVAVLDVGGREVTLRHLGRGHTGHDLVVEVEGTGDDTVVFAGDLVEQGAPPAFDDAFPAEWPGTLGRLHALARGPVVPGHGAVVDAAFVGAQREELLGVLTAVREGRTGPYDSATMRIATARLRATG